MFDSRIRSKTKLWTKINENEDEDEEEEHKRR